MRNFRFARPFRSSVSTVLLIFVTRFAIALFFFHAWPNPTLHTYQIYYITICTSVG